MMILETFLEDHMKRKRSISSAVLSSFRGAPKIEGILFLASNFGHEQHRTLRQKAKRLLCQIFSEAVRGDIYKLDSKEKLVALGIKSSNKIGGIIIAQLPEQKSEPILVAWLAVDEELRKKGMGQYLMKALCTMQQQMYGEIDIFLATEREEDAVDWYKKVGFVELGEWLCNKAVMRLGLENNYCTVEGKSTLVPLRLRKLFMSEDDKEDAKIAA